MRILHVTPTYYPAVRYGGPIWSVHSLCKALVRMGHEVEVVTTNVDGEGVSNVPVGSVVMLDGVKIRYFESNFFRKIFWSPSMSKYLKSAIPLCDFVHLHYVFLWPTLIAARISEANSVPWCVSPRGALFIELVRKKSCVVKKIWIKFFEKRTLENANFIHVTSELEANGLSDFNFDLQEVNVIPNGVEEQLFNARSDFVINEIKKPYLLFLGRISWKKGLDRLIPALSRISDFQLVIAGNDEEGLTEKLLSLAHLNGVGDRVVFAGPVYDDEKVSLLKNATILILPSYSENFGNVVLESLAVGRPVAVTAEVGLADKIEAAGVGVVIPSAPFLMGDFLNALLHNQKEIDAMAARASNYAKENFSWDAIAVQILKFYSKSLKKNPNR